MIRLDRVAAQAVVCPWRGIKLGVREFIGFFGKMHAISRQVPAVTRLNPQIDWKSRAAAFRMVSYGTPDRCTVTFRCPDLYLLAPGVLPPWKCSQLS